MWCAGGLSKVILTFLGCEALIAPVWKRIVAELIDTVFFALVVKVYFTDIDYR